MDLIKKILKIKVFVLFKKECFHKKENNTELLLLFYHL